MISFKHYLCFSLSLILFCACSYSPRHTKALDEKAFNSLSSSEQALLTDFKVLSSEVMKGRATGSTGSVQAQQYIINTLKRSDIKAYGDSYLQPFFVKGKGRYGHNIVAKVEGKNPLLAPIVISAHYDHLGAKGPSTVYYGADDNASGVSVAMYLAKRLSESPITHPVIFLFSDGEELNLLGAKAFLKDNPELIDKIKLNINLDMLAGSKSLRYLYYVDKNINELLSPEELVAFKALQQSDEAKTLYGFTRPGGYYGNKRVNWHQASDHAAFARHNIPYIYYGVGTHENYHTVKDTYSMANLSLLVSNAKRIYLQLIYLDQALD